MRSKLLSAFIPKTSLLLTLSVASVASAQVPPDTVQSDTSRVPVFELQGLTVVVPRPVSTTGGASAVEVSLDSMVMRPAPTLEQVLREMPLIQIRRNSRGEAQPALRGAEDRQIAILMDGVPLTLGWDARTDLSVIPLTAAQRVTMARGLSSVLHGPNVLGGVIEVDVARGAERQQPPRKYQVDLSLDHTGARAVGATAGTVVETVGGQWILRGGAGHHYREGLVLSDAAEDRAEIDPDLLSSDGDLRLNTDAERFDGFISARFRSETGSWLSLSSSGFSAERGVAPEAHVEEPRLWRYPEQNRLITALSGGTGQRETPWGEGDLEASIGFDLGSTDIEEFASPAYEEITETESSDDLTLTVRLMGDHSLGESAELRTAFTYADVRHDEVLNRVEENSYRQRLWSFGSEAEWRFRDLMGTGGSRFTVGAAVDGADTPESGGKPSAGRFWDWGGRLGITTLAYSRNLLLHGALSRRTRFPALRELYSGALGRFEPNPDLKPEILTGGEVGLTVNAAGMGFQAVAFHQRLEDGIVRSSLSTPEGKKYKRINQDRIRSSGLELLASGMVGPVLLSSDLTVQRVRGVGPGGEEVELEYEPAVAGKVAALLPLPLKLEGGATARFVGRQYCENPEVGGLEEFDGSRHLDLSLRRAFPLGTGSSGGVEASVSLDNATDALVWDQCGLPQPGRTLRFQLRLW